MLMKSEVKKRCIGQGLGGGRDGECGWGELYTTLKKFIGSNVYKGFPGGSVVKNPLANTGDTGLIPESGRPPGEGNATHSSILAWEIPCTEEPGRLLSMRSQRLRHDLDITTTNVCKR